MPYKDKSSNSKPWIAQVRINGRKLKHRCATKKEALEWEIQTKQNYSQKQKKTHTVSLRDWASLYLDFSKEKFVGKTYHEKRLAFRHFFASGFDADAQVNKLAPLLLLEHFQKQARLRSGHAANKDRKNLSAAWSWGIQYLGMPSENPFRHLAKQGEVRQDRRVPSLAEFWQVYSTATELQDKHMLLCYLYSGARRAELFQLRWQDVDFSNGRIRLYWKKNRLGTLKTAWLSMTYEAMQALEDQKALTGHLEWVFVEPGTTVPYQYRLQWLRRLCRRAGVQRFGFHGIRHLCASILASKGVPLVDIQAHLRHDHLSTTERYIHQLQESRAVVDALSGLSRIESPQRAPKK